MEMRNNDVANRLGGDAEFLQRVDGMNDEFTVSGGGGSFIEAGVDQNVACIAADQPDEKVEIGGLLMRIGRGDKIVVDAPSAVIGVANGVDFTSTAHVPFLRFWGCRGNRFLVRDCRRRNFSLGLDFPRRQRYCQTYHSRKREGIVRYLPTGLILLARWRRDRRAGNGILNERCPPGSAPINATHLTLGTTQMQRR